jgi:hypothetical protein
VVMQVLPQITFHRKWFVEELNIILFTVKLKIKDALDRPLEEKEKSLPSCKSSFLVHEQE